MLNRIRNGRVLSIICLLILGLFAVTMARSILNLTPLYSGGIMMGTDTGDTAEPQSADESPIKWMGVTTEVIPPCFTAINPKVLTPAISVPMHGSGLLKEIPSPPPDWGE